MNAPRMILLSLVLAAVASPLQPHDSEAAMIHRYSFTTDGSDAVGGANATLVNAAAIGGKLILNGTNGYADIPDLGSTVAGLKNFTIEAWVTRDQQGQWARIFDFGTNTAIFMILAAQGDYGVPSFDIRNSVTAVQYLYGAPVAFPIGVETHIAISVDYTGNFAALYINGVPIASADSTSVTGHIKLQGADLGSTLHNYLGRSEFGQDPYLKGSIDEFRIYNEALTPWEVLRSYQRGPDMDQSVDMPDVVVPATANLFGAGHSALPQPGGGGSGTRPVLIHLEAGCDTVVTFSSVLDSAKAGWTSYPWNRADGLANSSTTIDSCGGIAGILHSRTMFLAGVFLDDSEPRYPAPARLDFRPTGLTDQFRDLRPGLRQIFFIGDGKTSADSTQYFHVPSGATRLYLGFADASSFTGAPGYYDDDYGAMTARVSLCGHRVAAVPPSTSPGFELLGAYPNPVTGATEIAFTLSKPQSVALKVYDVSGHLVRNLTDGFLPAGAHSARWDRRDDRGRQVPSGVYFYSLDASGQHKSSRVVVVE